MEELEVENTEQDSAADSIFIGADIGILHNLKAFLYPLIGKTPPRVEIPIELIHAAIQLAQVSGAKTIFLQEGTYTKWKEIELPPGIEIKALPKK